MPPVNTKSPAPITIPGLGLTYTPLPQPEPMVPVARSQKEFKPGDRVLPKTWIGVRATSGSECRIVLIVNVDGIPRMLMEHKNYVYSDLNCWCYSANDVEVDSRGDWALKITMSEPTPQRFTDLPYGTVFTVKGLSGVTFIKGMFGDECMWYYQNQTYGMGIRPIPDLAKNSYQIGFFYDNGDRVRIDDPVCIPIGTLRTSGATYY